ncbi:MAG: ABC transporter permease, partial [Spirochaetes bacterium]
YGYPFAASIVKSFINRQGLLSFDNYIKTWDLYLKDILFTFGLTVSNTLIVGVISIILAVYFRLRESTVSRVLLYLYKMPIFIPFVVVAQMMNSFLAPHGLLNVVLAQTGLINMERPLQLLNFYGLSFGFIWKLVAFSAFIMHGGFQMIDNSYIEAARSAGARMPRVITRILIPMNRSSIMVALVLVYSHIVSTFTLPYMIISGKIPTTITVDIAHRVNYFRDFGVANTLGVISYIMVLFCALYYLRTTVRTAKEKGLGRFKI